MQFKQNRKSVRNYFQTVVLVVHFTIASRSLAQDDSIAPPHAPVPLAEAQKIADGYLAKMTLEEKVTIIHGNALYRNGGVPRLGIPDFFPSDGPCSVRPELDNGGNYIYGGKETDCATALPTLSAVCATWDLAMARLFGQTLGSEVRARGKDMSLGPSINIMRTPLGGRTFEYMGEDPYLTAHMCVPVIQGVQSNDVSACIKHFALNNQELNRDSVNVNVDDRALHEIYLPGFEAAVKQGDTWGLMGAYNKFRGQWCCENAALLQTILRSEFGYTGAIISDWGAVHDAHRAVLAGTDMDSGNNHRYDALVQMVKRGEIPESVINGHTRNMLILMARMRKIGPDAAQRCKGEINTPAHQAAARKIAQEAIVLLKNDRAILPLDPATLKNLLVIGRHAVVRQCLDKTITGGCNLDRAGGSGEAKPLYEITPLEGITRRLGDKVKVDFVEAPTEAFTALPAANGGWDASYFNNTQMQGAPAVHRRDAALQFDWKGQTPLPGINAQNFSACWTGQVVAPETGDYKLRLMSDDGSRLYVDGKMVVDFWRIGPILPAYGLMHLEAGKTYLFRVEYYQAQGMSAVSLDWQIPSSIGALAQRVKAADAVLIFTGNTHAEEQEGKDRTDIKLLGSQDQMVEQLAGLNPRTIVVNQSGAPVAMPWVDQVPAIVQNWFCGQESGNALASVLFGDVNPSGRLPFTFPKKLEDVSAHALKDYRADAETYGEGIFVGYRWYDSKKIQPLFPFGHGLSYTSFAYGEPQVSGTMTNNSTLTVQIPITNTGQRAGAEVVQLYLHAVAPTVQRPDQELKGFTRLILAPGETKMAEFKLTMRDLSYWSVDEKGWKADPGTFEIRIGASSRDIRRKAVLEFKTAPK